MTNVNLNLKGLPATAKILKARQLLNDLTRNPDLLQAQSPISQIASAADDLEAAYSEVRTAKQLVLTKTSLLHEKEGTLDSILQKLAGCLGSVEDRDGSNSSPVDIPFTGYSVVTNPADVFQEPIATESDSGIGIDSNWGKVRHFRSYLLGQNQACLSPLRTSLKG